MTTLGRESRPQALRLDRDPAQGEPYKSPQSKLVRFFDRSRTQWKAKCRTAKATIKGLKNRIRFLEESKARWKSRAKALEEEVARVNRHRTRSEPPRASAKKNLG